MDNRLVRSKLNLLKTSIHKSDQDTYQKIRKKIEEDNRSKRSKNNSRTNRKHSPEYIELRRQKESIRDSHQPLLDNIRTSDRSENWIIWFKVHDDLKLHFHFRCKSHTYHTLVIQKHHLSRFNLKCRFCAREERLLLKQANYYKLVWKITEANYLKYQKLINPTNKLRNSLIHLDHIYSIKDGFDNKVDAGLIASPVNLRLINKRENLQKSSKSYQTLAELTERHSKMISK